MRISRIYYNGSIIQGDHINLPEETSHYIQNVLRLKNDSTIAIFNGKGQEFQAKIIEFNKKTVTIKILELISRHTESPLDIHLVQAVCRGEKMDWILQKAVELGVTKITPLMTEFSNIKLDVARATKRLDHWNKVIISACEQSGRTLLPILNPIQNFKTWIAPNLAPLMIFCHPGASTSLKMLPLSKEVLLLIGPEGGLSPEEVTVAQNCHFVGVNLGPRILRTETAPLVAITLLQFMEGDFS